MVTAPVWGCTDTSTPIPFLSLNSWTTSAGRVTASELPAWTSFLFIYVLDTYARSQVKSAGCGLPRMLAHAGGPSCLAPFSSSPRP